MDASFRPFVPETLFWECLSIHTKEQRTEGRVPDESALAITLPDQAQARFVLHLR
jgi:hypothetical protein